MIQHMLFISPSAFVFGSFYQGAKCWEKAKSSIFKAPPLCWGLNWPPGLLRKTLLNTSSSLWYFAESHLKCYLKHPENSSGKFWAFEFVLVWRQWWIRENRKQSRKDGKKNMEIIHSLPELDSDKIGKSRDYAHICRVNDRFAWVLHLCYD